MYTTNTKPEIPRETARYLSALIEKGGPEPHDYLLFSDIVNHLRDGEVDCFREIIKDALNENTLIGHGFVKPFGYPGDYSIIHNIYRYHINRNPKYRNWDHFFQNQAGAQAVRNRKDYFLRCCSNLENSGRKNINVLILGSGPATDVKEYLSTKPDSRICFSLIDFDQNAIDFARSQNSQYNGSVEYARINVLRYKPFKLFDLIWSAGLFDYFRDRHFVYVINKYYKYLNEGGEYIIGNFSTVNPTKKLMEVLSAWYLNHRSKYDLIRLAVDANVDEDNIQVDSEELGVNLFLKIRQSSDSNPLI